MPFWQKREQLLCWQPGIHFQTAWDLVLFFKHNAPFSYLMLISRSRNFLDLTLSNNNPNLRLDTTISNGLKNNNYSRRLHKIRLATSGNIFTTLVFPFNTTPWSWLKFRHKSTLCSHIAHLTWLHHSSLYRKICKLKNAFVTLVLEEENWHLRNLQKRLGTRSDILCQQSCEAVKGKEECKLARHDCID